LENRTQTIGRALDHLELKVVDKSGKVVDVNEPGELLVRGYNTMIGYWDERGKTDETFTPDRFLKTGY
jgi:long-subunit acyl-CoA synthetase (AMP-forming)